MLSDDEIKDLSDDPKLALIEYVELLNKSLEKNIRPGNWSAERTYVDHIRAYCETNDVGFSFTPPPSSNFSSYYSVFKSKLNYEILKLRLQNLRGRGSMEQGQIELNDDYRDEIHRHLLRVRKIVNAAEIEERLRENIIKRLNALDAEVDKSRSGLMRFADALIEMTAVVGDAAQNLEPAVKIMERIGGIFGKARKENDVKRISGGEEQKLITGPTADADTGDSSEASDTDDEIPF